MILGTWVKPLTCSRNGGRVQESSSGKGWAGVEGWPRKAEAGRCLALKITGDQLGSNCQS